MTVVRFEKLLLSGSTEPKKTLEVKTAEINLDTYKVPAGKILIKAAAWAINPTDWKHIVFGIGQKGTLAGSDVSGTVVKVGPEVKGKFEVGDDVGAFLHGSYYPGGEVGAFAGYTLVDDYATVNYGKGGLKTAADKDNIIHAGPVQSFEGAASITLGLFTVGVTFNHAFELVNANTASYKGKKVIIWGGATSTGVLAIQIAKKIYGLKVIAVASQKHHSNLKKLGADYTYDYKTPGVVSTIKKEHPDIKYGYDTVANAQTFQSVYDTLADNSILDNLLSLDESKLTKKDPSKHVKFEQTLLYRITGHELYFGSPKPLPASIDIRNAHIDFVQNKISRKFLQNELNHNEILLIKDSFLKSIEEGLDLLRQDKISGQKVVIRALDVEKHK